MINFKFHWKFKLHKTTSTTVSHIAHDWVANDSPKQVTNESGLTRPNHKWVMSHTNESGISHVSHEWITNESCRTRTSQESVVFHTFLSVRGGVGCSWMRNASFVTYSRAAAAWHDLHTWVRALLCFPVKHVVVCVLLWCSLCCSVWCSVLCIVCCCIMCCSVRICRILRRRIVRWNSRARISLSFSRVQGHPGT